MAGGGLSGATAALAALQCGAAVTVYEKSRFPRHKVCGEYLSPEAVPILQDLRMWDAFLAQRPATVRRLVLHFARSEKRCLLPQEAFGLSRYRLDALLLNAAAAQGAQIVNEPAPDGCCILATGRAERSTRGGRLFGFKAHFEGPANDAIELYFFRGCYVGVNAVEEGITNVCGLGPESLLRAYGFDIDDLVRSSPKLADRLQPLQRKWKWLTVGPLVFRNRFRDALPDGQYPAGDALSFVDPFTGSGMLSALTMGRLAGLAAARGTSTQDYLRECRGILERPFQFASLFRNLLSNGWGEHLAGLVPGPWLVNLTRPHRVV